MNDAAIVLNGWTLEEEKQRVKDEKKRDKREEQEERNRLRRFLTFTQKRLGRGKAESVSVTIATRVGI